MKEKVYEKFEAELIRDKDNRLLMVISDSLLAMCSDEDVCKKLLADGKSLKGALEAMKNEARKQASKGCACLSFDEGMDIVKKYFGIETAKSETFGTRSSVHKKKSIFDMI